MRKQTIIMIYHKKKYEDDKSFYPGCITFNFTSFSTVFQSYQDNEFVIMK